MAAKPKFAGAPKPPDLTADQAAHIERGRGKDKAPVAASEPMHRMSVDIPNRLHKRFKAACALAELKTSITSEIIAFIERRTAGLEKANQQTHKSTFQGFHQVFTVGEAPFSGPRLLAFGNKKTALARWGHFRLSDYFANIRNLVPEWRFRNKDV